MPDKEFRLPNEIFSLWEARLALRRSYHDQGIRLEFTFDGNLVGDIGEACAVLKYGMTLTEKRSHPGIDGYASDGTTTVQVKAKGLSTKAIAFSYAEAKADHLLVIQFDFERGTGRAVYNGPERYIREHLPSEPWQGQKQVSLAKVRAADAKVQAHERIPMLR